MQIIIIIIIRHTETKFAFLGLEETRSRESLALEASPFTASAIVVAPQYCFFISPNDLVSESQHHHRLTNHIEDFTYVRVEKGGMIQHAHA